MKKKIPFIPFCVLFSFLLCFGLQAAEPVGNTIVGNLKFNFYEDFTATVFAANNEISGVITVPGNVSYEGRDYQVTAIGENGFEECKAMTGILLPATLKAIGDNAFGGCTSLLSVEIPDGVSSLGGNVFITCTALTSVTLPSQTASIPDAFFSGCVSMPSVTIPESVTSIGGGAFYECKKLETLVIPDNVTHVGKLAFRICESLNTVTIGKRVATFEKQSFAGNKKIKTIFSLNPVPPVLNGENHFDNFNATLYVPLGSKEAYKAADIWKSFPMKDCFEDGTKAFFVKVTQKGAGDVLVNERLVASDTLREGSKVVFKITNKAGGTIKKVLMNGSNVTDKLAGNTYTLEAITADARFEVEFENTAFEVKATYDPSKGSVKINGETVSPVMVPAAGKAEFVITPKEGCSIGKIIVNGQDQELTGNTYTVDPVHEEIALEVVFTGESSIYTTNDNGVKMYSSFGKIVVENIAEGAIVTISDASGRPVYRGTDRTVSLAAGVYIVRAGDTVRKVTVK